MSLVYTGIGARDAPADVCTIAHSLGRALASAHWELRSGAADGMDAAFERGAREVGGKLELYLPYQGYNGSKSPHYAIGPQALAMAQSLHPAWDTLSSTVRRMHAASCHHTLGLDLRSPSAFSICWTADGCETEATRTRRTGGTATGIVLADRHNIPLFNLQVPAARHRLNELLERLGLTYRVPVDSVAPEQSALF